MAIHKRLSEDRKIVSHYDDALAFVDSELVQKYVKTLNIDDLGDMRSLPQRPTVFTVKPLTTKWEHLAYDTRGIDYWGVFSTHVTAATELPFELEFREGVLADKVRDMFPPNIVQNVASIIIALSNNNGDSIPFTPPGGFWRWLAEVKAHLATKESASSVAAATNSFQQALTR
jgi:hypothetical protein